MAPYVAGSVECFLVHRRPGSQAEFELVCKPQSGLRTGLSLIALEVVGSIPSRAIIASVRVTTTGCGPAAVGEACWRR